MPSRRRVLLGVATPLVAGPDCLGNVDKLNTSDEDENEDFPPGITVVRYEELSDRDQLFVHYTIVGDGHIMGYINRDGERVYTEYNLSTGRHVTLDDPLVLESVDEALQDVYQEDAILEKNGRYYQSTGGRMHADDADYRYHLAVVQADDCHDPTHLDEFSGFDAKLASVLLDRGDAVVGSDKFDPVAQADVYFGGTELFEFEDQFGHPNGTCLAVEGETVRVERTGSELANIAHWELSETDIDQD